MDFSQQTDNLRTRPPPSSNPLMSDSRDITPQQTDDSGSNSSPNMHGDNRPIDSVQNDESRSRHTSGSFPIIRGDSGEEPRVRHTSGSNPAIRGYIIDSRREGSPSRPSGSPLASPGLSGGTFVLPPPSPRTPRIPSSLSDYTMAQGGRYRFPPQDATEFDRPRSEYSTGEIQQSAARRNTMDPTLYRSDGHTTDVENQCEGILQCYMYERYSRDLLNSEGQMDMPQSPVIIENYFSHQSQNNCSAVGRQLAQIGDRIDASYREEFRGMSRMLGLQHGAFDMVYDAFSRVCRKLFDDGNISWGRIVALLQFGYHLAIENLRYGIGDFMAEIIKFLVRFIASEKIGKIYRTIAQWIAQQGGWQAVVVSNKGLTIALLLTSAITTFLLYWKPWQR